MRPSLRRSGGRSGKRRCARLVAWATTARLAGTSVAGSSLSSGSYDYHGIVPHYCHVSMDWGPLPEPPDGAMELLQAQVFFRHGARVQAGHGRCWEGDDDGQWSCVNPSGAHGSAGDESSEECYGQLVSSGYEQERRNGERLREAYVKRAGILPERLPDGDGSAWKRLSPEVMVRSTASARTVQSAMALLAGLYPELDSQALPFAQEDAVQAVSTRSPDKETMAINPSMCPSAAWRVQAHFQDLPEAAAEEMLSLCRQLAPGRMNTQECAWWLTHLVDCLMSRICPTVSFTPRNLTVPAHFFSDDSALLRRVWKALDEASTGYFGTMVSGGAFSALASEILHSAEAAARKKSKVPRLMLFSGHDTGPMEPLSLAFGLRGEPPYWPAFASMIILEVWDSPSGPFTRWIYDGKVASGPQAFEEFRKTASGIAGFSRHCNDPDPRAPSASLLGAVRALPRGTAFYIAAAAVAAVAALIVGLVGAVRYANSRRRRRGKELTLQLPFRGALPLDVQGAREIEICGHGSQPSPDP